MPVRSDAAMPTDSATMLLEYFIMSRRIARRSSLAWLTTTRPSGSSSTITGAGNGTPCARARVWKTSPAYSSGRRTGSQRLPPRSRARRATVHSSAFWPPR